MLKTQRFIGVISLLIAAVAGADTPATGHRSTIPPGATDRESWYVVRIEGSAVGFARETQSTGPAGAASSQFMDLTMSRMGQEINMRMTGEIKDGPDGRLESARVSVKASMMSAVTTAVLEGDTVRHTTESAGFEQKRSIPWEEGAVGQATADVVIEDRLRAGETDISVRSFEIDSGEFKTMRVRVVRTEKVEVDGREQNALVLEETEDDSDVVMSTVWLDEDYVPFKTVMVQMGLEIVIERVAPEAIDSLQLEPDFDIIRQSMIPCVGYPRDPGEVDTITMRLEFEVMPALERDLDGPNQTVVGRGDGYIDLVLSRGTSNRLVMTGDQIEERAFLEPDKYIQSSHPDIVAVADSIRRATGTQGWKLARALAGWVNGYITGKNFGQGFASALEVLETRSGDCTEHSMLLTALLRAAGIPARPAVGLAYSGGQFVGHMWTEAYLDYWRTLDALDLDTNPIRIRVSAAESGRAVDEKDLVRAYSVVGGLRVEVLEYQTVERP